MEQSFLEGLENKIVLKNECFEFLKISTDTRTISSGDFYIPLKGANFDGELFIEKAVDLGAVGFLTTSEEIAKRFVGDDRVKLIAVVPDTKIAYMELASARIRSLGAKVVAITGSSGKTTVKEMVYSVVAQSFKTHKTLLNHNNEIGFCQTIFEAPDGIEVLILEMGMRGLGEIELISKYAKPDIAVVTNVGTAHIGRLGSRENIAVAKCEVAKYLKPDGTFIAQNDFLTKQTVNFVGEKRYFSVNDVEILLQEIGKTVYKYNGEVYEVPIEGLHNVENSMAAIFVGEALGQNVADIKSGLLNFRPIENRWNVEKIGRFSVVNDCYNANPESMRATIDTVLNLYENPVLILGNMGELGDDSEKYHKQVGEFINKHPRKSDKLVVVTVGELAKCISDVVADVKKKHFDTNEHVAEYLLKNENIGNILFFKASRSMKFEQIINEIKGDMR